METKEYIPVEDMVIKPDGYTPLFDYHYCCLCFEKLYEATIVKRDGQRHNVCLECENKVNW